MVELNIVDYDPVSNTPPSVLIVGVVNVTIYCTYWNRLGKQGNMIREHYPEATVKYNELKGSDDNNVSKDQAQLKSKGCKDIKNA